MMILGSGLQKLSPMIFNSNTFRISILTQLFSPNGMCLSINLFVKKELKFNFILLCFKWQAISFIYLTNIYGA